MTFAILTSDTWNAELYGSLSVSSRLSAAIKGGTARVKILWFLHRTNSACSEMLNKIDNAIADAGEKRGKTKQVDTPTRERVENTADRLEELYRILDSIHVVCCRHRMQNATKTASGMARLRYNADRVLEIADWLRDSLDPSNYRDAFARAMREFENGETVPAREVCR